MNTDRKLRSRLLTALPIAALALSLAACSGAADRPTKDELADGIATIFEDAGQAGIFTAEQLQCMADGMLDSEIPDADLANLADGRDEQTSEESYTLVQSTIADLATSCIGDAPTETPTPAPEG